MKKWQKTHDGVQTLAMRLAVLSQHVPLALKASPLRKHDTLNRFKRNGFIAQLRLGSYDVETIWFREHQRAGLGNAG